MMFITALFLQSHRKIMQLFFTQTAAHKDYAVSLRKSFLIKTFIVVVALIGFNAVGLLAQTVVCPTRIEEPGGDGGTYDLFFAADPCANYPNGTPITINGGVYVVSNCGQVSGGGSEYSVTLTYDSGTLVVLATDAPITIGTCVYNAMGNLIVCPTLTATSSASYDICSGDNTSDIALTSTRNDLDMKLVYFTSAQSGTAMYTGGTAIGSTVTPSGSSAPYAVAFNNLSFPANTTSSNVIYYVYAILDVADAQLTDANCRPNVAFTVTVKPLVTPSVSIAANPTGSITSGTSVTFTATPTNGGTTPSYQWKKNNIDVGTNSATYIDAALANNDVIKVVMTSTAACASSAMATSNDVTITVVTSGVCPTRIEEPVLDGSAYDLFFAADPCANYPNGTPITINGANYEVSNCGQVFGGSEYYVSLTYVGGTPVVLATAAPVNIGTCAYDAMGNFITPGSCTPPALTVTSVSAICAGSSVNLATLVTSTGTLSFYTNRTDAQNGTNALTSGTVTTAVAKNYYVRSINAQGCFSVAEITVLMSAPVCGIIQVTAN
jgi:hypothetical protein